MIFTHHCTTLAWHFETLLWGNLTLCTFHHESRVFCALNHCSLAFCVLLWSSLAFVTFHQESWIFCALIHGNLAFCALLWGSQAFCTFHQGTGCFAPSIMVACCLVPSIMVACCLVPSIILSLRGSSRPLSHSDWRTHHSALSTTSLHPSLLPQIPK